MMLRDAAAALAVGAAWIGAAPTRRITRVVAAWQALATAAVVALHLRGRVAWELDLRRPVYLASVARGESLDRGATLLLSASMLSLALALLRWRPGVSPGDLRAAGGVTAALLAASALLLSRG